MDNPLFEILGDPRKNGHNNVGNIRDTKTGKFRSFNSREEGVAALEDDLKWKNKKGFNTVQSIINRYAPPSENDTAAYVKNVSAALGVKPTDKIDLTDPKVMAVMRDAMIRQEGNRNVAAPIVASTNVVAPTEPAPVATPTAKGLDIKPPTFKGDTKNGYSPAASGFIGAADSITAGVAKYPVAAASWIADRVVNRNASQPLSWRDALKYGREAQGQAEQENPRSYWGGQVAGGVGLGALTGGGSALAQIGKAGLQGAVSGATSREADLKETLADAALGGAFGAGAGAAGVAVSKGLGGIQNAYKKAVDAPALKAWKTNTARFEKESKQITMAAEKEARRVLTRAAKEDTGVVYQGKPTTLATAEKEAAAIRQRAIDEIDAKRMKMHERTAASDDAWDAQDEAFRVWPSLKKLGSDSADFVKSGVLSIPTAAGLGAAGATYIGQDPFHGAAIGASLGAMRMKGELADRAIKSGTIVGGRLLNLAEMYGKTPTTTGLVKGIVPGITSQVGPAINTAHNAAQERLLAENPLFEILGDPRKKAEPLEENPLFEILGDPRKK